MATESIRVSGVVPASPERVYEAFLTGKEHADMTDGGTATASNTVGGAFTAWQGYIWGRNLELDPGRRIVQAWRTTEFPPTAPDSRVEILLEAVEGGTRVTFVHTEIPEGQGDGYRDGWRSFYLEPMAKYFEQSTRPTQILDAETLTDVRSEPRKPLAKAQPDVRPARAKKKPAKKKPAKKKPAKKPTRKTAPAKKAAKKKAAKKPARKPAKKPSRKPAKKAAKKAKQKK